MMPRDLKVDLETLRTVANLAQNRDITRAAALAEQTLAGGLEHPMLLNVLATRLEQAGDLPAALKLLERAVSIAPGDVGARNALSICLLRLDRPAEALRHADELLKLHPDLPFVHLNKGNALIALGSLGRAMLCHRRALELDPENFAAAAALASIATHRGAHEEARRWADMALTKAPGYPDAVLSLAAWELSTGALGSAENRLQRLIIDSRASPLDRARGMGLLADVLDADGRYAEAFTAYASCNEALRRIHARFAGSNALDYSRRLITAMERVDAGAWHPRRPGTRADTGPGRPSGHVFLMGFPRSGTTLLEVVLDGHPQVASAEELELLADGVLRFMREPLDLQPLAGADDAGLQASRQAYWDGVRQAGIEVDGKVFIDKYPLNTLKLPLIARLFPDAKLLFARRDPRDVVLSCFRRRFQMNPSMYELLTLAGAAHFYDAVMTFADQALPACGLAQQVVRYETLVAEFEAEMHRICEFLGIGWLPGMSDFAGRVAAREQATPSTAQLSRGLVSSSVGQWRHYQAELQSVGPILGKWVERFGYAGY